MPGALPRPLGIRHVALRVADVAKEERFYVDTLGMTVEWRPDPDNVYLHGWGDNLALHRDPAASGDRSGDRLDHFGIVLKRPEDVDAWAAHLEARRITLEEEPRTHRDGARSFYVRDPEGNRIQFIYHPPISDKEG